mmetsp:Transcript_529/g.742  ORF Transcript_529/g.742 Transcript_529/m.742 type:complete len:162 (+) Transcript_529:90-575(+)
MEGVQFCLSLEELWLGKNKIEAITGLEDLSRLRRLDVQSNRLCNIQGLTNAYNLEELYISNNAIIKIEGLSSLAKLNIIDLSCNKIEKIEGLDSLQNLTDLWIGTNQIPSFNEVIKLAPLAKLECLYLEHNPIYKDFEYRIRTAALLPSLKQLDATPIRRD